MASNYGFSILSELELSIQHGRLIKFSSRFPIFICCKTGWLLLTIQGDVSDYQLSSGDKVLLPKNMVALVEGSGILFFAKKPKQRAIIKSTIRNNRSFFYNKLFSRIVSLFQ